MKFFSDIRLLFVAIWLGAAVFFILVAQSAFAVLPSREMAGAVVSRTLMLLNLGGIGVAILLVLTSFVGRGRIGSASLWAERVLAAILGILCGAAQFVVGIWLATIRAQIGVPIDEVAADNPLKVQFDSLHRWSQWLLLASMAAVLGAYFVISNRRFDKKDAAKTDNVYDFSKEFKV